MVLLPLLFGGIWSVKFMPEDRLDGFALGLGSCFSVVLDSKPVELRNSKADHVGEIGLDGIHGMGGPACS